MDITVSHAEPEDYESLHRIFSGPKAVVGTLQMPFPRAEMWRERLSEPPEGLYSLVACVEDEVVGEISLHTSPTRWRMRHVGSIGMAVRDDWQGKGVGTALMETALELADNWLNLTRIELRVYVLAIPEGETVVRALHFEPELLVEGHSGGVVSVDA